WNLVGLGAAIGAGVIVVDELLKRSGKSLPPLAVGMGMYLPTQVTMLVILGAVLGHLYNRWAMRQSAPDLAERMGVLTATGLIVGDSLFNIAYAAIVAATDNPDALAIVDDFPASLPLGVTVFAAILGYAYWRMRRDGSSA
ncbi:MAG: oligopeptide transporter, OPT family, partial [Novosphingobium sp.]|nr:oligopeptide transporter, OPT family [Novosphingobium sp.]